MPPSKIYKRIIPKVLKVHKLPCPMTRCIVSSAMTCILDNSKNSRGCTKYPCGRCFKKNIPTKLIKNKPMITCPMAMCRGRIPRMKMVCKKHPKSGKRVCSGVRVPPTKTCKTTYPKTKNSNGCPKYLCGLDVCTKFVPKPVPSKACRVARCVRKPLCTYSRGPIVNGCPKYLCGIAKCKKPVVPKTGGVMPRPPKVVKKPTPAPKTIHINKIHAPVHANRYISEHGNVTMESTVTVVKKH